MQNMPTIAIGMSAWSTGAVAHRLGRPCFGSMYQSNTAVATSRMGPATGIIGHFLHCHCSATGHSMPRVGKAYSRCVVSFLAFKPFALPSSNRGSSFAGLRLFVGNTGCLPFYFPGQVETIVATPNAKHANTSGGYRTRAALNLRNLGWMPALLGRPAQIRRSATASIDIPAYKLIGVSPVKHRGPRWHASRNDASIRLSFRRLCNHREEPGLLPRVRKFLTPRAPLQAANIV